ncbi:MAG TPA: hypothetical protein VM867_07350 [Xanthobacteraceae bacterium]|nr:hypothetical protein [Xanthobacteraceae bacterium]
MIRYFKLQRLLDGSIDFDFYRRRALAPRRGRIRYFFRRKLLLRHAMYAVALCVGLAVGETLPLPSQCLNCEYAGVAALAGNILPAHMK